MHFHKSVCVDWTAYLFGDGGAQLVGVFQLEADNLLEGMAAQVRITVRTRLSQG